jgi:hypothetical protein
MDEELLIPVRLSAEGYGTIQEIRDMRADLVIAALTYTNFLSDYEETLTEINREK